MPDPDLQIKGRGEGGGRGRGVSKNFGRPFGLKIGVPGLPGLSGLSPGSATVIMYRTKGETL